MYLLPGTVLDTECMVMNTADLVITALMMLRCRHRYERIKMKKKNPSMYINIITNCDYYYERKQQGL